MDISAVSTLANSNNTSAVADKLKNNVKNLSSDSTEDELKSTLKDFESYFVEQVIKEMKDSMTIKSDDEDFLYVAVQGYVHGHCHRADE